MQPRTLRALVVAAVLALGTTACLDDLDLGGLFGGLLGGDDEEAATAGDGEADAVAEPPGGADSDADLGDDLPDQEVLDAAEEVLNPVDEADGTEALIAEVLAGDVYVAPLHDVDIPPAGTAVVEVAGNTFTVEGIECEVELGGADQRVSFEIIDADVWLDVWRYTTDGSTYLTEGVRLTTGYDRETDDLDSLGLVQVELFDGSMDYSMGGGDLPIVRYDDGAVTAAGRMFGILGDQASGAFTLGANCG